MLEVKSVAAQVMNFDFPGQVHGLSTSWKEPTPCT
jgi:hypothetical protein